MARHWLGGEPPDQDEPLDQDEPADHTAAPDPRQTDPMGDTAESERDEEPADVHAAEPERPDGRARLTDRVGTAARRAVTGLTAALIARLPAAQAAMLPRLTRLICAVIASASARVVPVAVSAPAVVSDTVTPASDPPVIATALAF